MKSRSKPFKPKDLQSNRRLNVLEAAGELSIHPETLREFIRDGCPAEKRGKEWRVDAPEVAAWMKANGHTGVQGRPWGTESSPDLDAARLRKENALASKYELQTARERGRLIEVESVQQWIIRNHISARNHLLGLPAKAVVLMAGRNAGEQQSILETLIREALETIANMADDLGNGLEAA